MWRDEGRGLMRLTVEVPIEEGELIARALDCAVAGGEVTTDIDPDAVAESKGTAWRAQQADALVAVAKSYLDGGHGGEGGATADHYQVVVHADAKSLRGGTGLLGSTDRDREAVAVRLQPGDGRRGCERQPARRRAQAAHGIDATAAARSTPAIAAARSRAVIANAISPDITWSIGSTAARPRPTT